MTYTPGPGDILGQYSGHPHDPRTPEDDSDDTTEEAIVDVFGYIVRRAWSIQKERPQ
jgi:hypothetical protein